MDFYSAKLLFIILVNDGRPRKRNHYDEVVIVFRSRNLDSAFREALKLGRAQETKYLNVRKQSVRWALVKILSLDWIGKRINGKEVASHLYYSTGKTAISPMRRVRPEKSKPENSL